MLKAFAEVLGLPCWGVKKGQGSCLTLEFGEPHLLIREPVQANSRFPRIRRLMGRRHVYVAGSWFLWVWACNWSVRTGGKLIGDSSTPRRAARAARELDGQKLVGIILAKRGARTRFLFDLGSVLETTPYSRMGEQWMLYTPKKRVLVFRGDRRYSIQRSDRPEPKGPWKAA